MALIRGVWRAAVRRAAILASAVGFRTTAACLTVLTAALAGGASWFWFGGSLRHGITDGGEPGTAAVFVGSEVCAGCHQAQAERWRGSQHRQAMAHAAAASVLGDFNDASFDYYGVRSRFFRRDGKHFVETDGADGRLATFEIKYTFGIEPLQQYLIAFPDGRVQALPMHWTRLNQNWNFMCAECHSTGVHKNYDAASDRYATSFAEISVGCEACHGEGSRHVAWARARESWWPLGRRDDPTKGLSTRFDERDGIVWRPDRSTGNATRNVAPAFLRKEVETCGRCHARRGGLSEDWSPGRPLADTHVVSLLAQGLYYADGQMQDEVYNYGSFKQSRMFAAGVTCSDCHEPHSARLRASGEAICAHCHAPDKYAAVTHHHHPREAGTPAPTCTACHMPAHTYMVIDRRHDHSFRIPRPDLSAKLGTPDACSDCHTDKSAGWAAAAIERWNGPARKGFQRYAEAFHSAWSGGAEAAALLAVVAGDARTPSIAHASALTELAPYLSPANVNLARSGLSDPDPMVRIGALDMLAGAPPSQIWPLAAPLLSDSVRGVRVRAVELLAAVSPASRPAADRDRFERAAAEFVAAQHLNADRPEARATLGNFHARSGRAAEAEQEYKAALRLSPHYVPAAINLADLYRQLGRDGDGENILREAIAASPRDAGLHHALGLALTRLKQAGDAVVELQRAAELEPQRARYAYVYAVALNSTGRAAEAMTVLKEILAQHPDDRDTLLALVSFSRDAGDPGTALHYAERLAAVSPADARLTTLIETLRREIGAAFSKIPSARAKEP